MSTHNLCFEQKYKKYQNFYLKIFIFWVVKFSVCLNRHVFIMSTYKKCFHGEMKKIVFWMHLLSRAMTEHIAPDKTLFRCFFFNKKVLIFSYSSTKT